MDLITGSMVPIFLGGQAKRPNSASRFFAEQPHVNNHYLYLDSVGFSNQPIPEPSVFGLFALGSLVLGWRWRSPWDKMKLRVLTTKKRCVQRPARKVGVPSLFDGDKSPAESADKSAHSKACGCGASRVRRFETHFWLNDGRPEPAVPNS